MLKRYCYNFFRLIRGTDDCFTRKLVSLSYAIDLCFVCVNLISAKSSFPTIKFYKKEKSIPAKQPANSGSHKNAVIFPI